MDLSTETKLTDNNQQDMGNTQPKLSSKSANKVSPITIDQSLPAKDDNKLSVVIEQEELVRYDNSSYFDPKSGV